MINKQNSKLYRHAISLLDTFEKECYQVTRSIIQQEVKLESTLLVKTHTLQPFDIYDGDWSIYIKTKGNYITQLDCLYSSYQQLLLQVKDIELEILNNKIENIDESYQDYYNQEKERNQFWYMQTKDGTVGVLNKKGKEVVFSQDFKCKRTKRKYLESLIVQKELLEKNNINKLLTKKEFDLTLITKGLHPIYGSSFQLKSYLFGKQQKEQFIKDYQEMYLQEIYISTLPGILQQEKLYCSKEKIPDIIQEDLDYIKKYKELLESTSDSFVTYQDINRSSIILRESTAKALLDFVLYSVSKKYQVSIEELSLLKPLLEVKFIQY